MLGRPKHSKNIKIITLNIEAEDLVILDRQCRKEKMSRAKFLAKLIRIPDLDALINLQKQLQAIEVKEKKTYRLNLP